MYFSINHKGVVNEILMVLRLAMENTKHLHNKEQNKTSFE